ncbi:hypothetical protein ACP4OV_027572 [Aristida adscensionis]
MASSTPRTPAPERPPPPVPLLTPPPPPLEESPSPSPPADASPSTPGDEYHTPPPSLGEASPREEKEAALTHDGSAAGASAGAITMSPPLSPVRLPSPHRLPLDSHTGNTGQEGAGDAAALARRARPQLRLATGLVRTPSQGSLAKTPSPSHGSLAKSPYPSPGSLAMSPSPSPSPSPPSPLTPTPAPAPAPALAAPNGKSGQATPKRAEARKPPASPAAAAITVRFDPVEEAVTSPLRIAKPRLVHHQRAAAAAENGAAATTAVPPDVAAVAAVGERRTLSVALRLATAVLSLVSFSLMASAKTSGWAGDYYARHQQYRYAVAVNVIVCAYSIAQSFGEIRRLISPRFIYRSLSSYYFSLFLDQVLAYVLMSASSAAASRNDLWVSRFGSDPFTKKISSAVWLSFLALLALAANSLISTANLFSMV